MLQAWRLSGWRSLRTRGEPILWVLHVGYAWLPLGFALKAWALAGGATIAQFWQHAFGIGAVATMILAVMTRAALGHSGRPLTVARGIAWAYGLLSLSALARVLLPHLGWLDYATSLLVAALLWTAAFTLFVAYYGPILTTPRIDGKLG
ncbi:MAG: NnrS family protein [Steroidobacteraceae bacterium]